MSKLKIVLFLFLLLLLSLSFTKAISIEKGKKTHALPATVPPKQYSVDLVVNNIPPGQQTLFIPLSIDTMVLDMDKAELETLSSKNILAVTSNSKDKAGPGIGLIKFDNDGLPSTLEFKVFLKPVGEGKTSISLTKVSEESTTLPAKGIQLSNDINVDLKTKDEVIVTEEIVKGKKKLSLSKSNLIIEVKRPSAREETIFIPIISTSKNIVDLDETFGHAVVAPGISVKSFSSVSLEGYGSGVEIVLSQEAEKDFSINIDLSAKNSGKAKFFAALPQKTRTAIISGPTVSINPQDITVDGNPIVTK